MVLLLSTLCLLVVCLAQAQQTVVYVPAKCAPYCNFRDLVKQAGPSTALLLISTSPNVGVQANETIMLASLTMQANEGTSLTFDSRAGLVARTISLYNHTSFVTWKNSTFENMTLFSRGAFTVASDGQDYNSALVSRQLVTYPDSVLTMQNYGVLYVSGPVHNISGRLMDTGFIWPNEGCTMYVSPTTYIDGTAHLYVDVGHILAQFGNVSLGGTLHLNTGVVASAPGSTLSIDKFEVYGHDPIVVQGTVEFRFYSIYASVVQISVGSTAFFGDRDLEMEGGGVVLNSKATAILGDDEFPVENVTAAGVDSTLTFRAKGAAVRALTIRSGASLNVCGSAKISVLDIEGPYQLSQTGFNNIRFPTTC